jgi:hypothetical protein
MFQTYKNVILAHEIYCVYLNVLYIQCSSLFLKHNAISQRMFSVDSFVACQAFHVFPVKLMTVDIAYY